MDDFDSAQAALAEAVLAGGTTLADVALEVGASAARLGVPLHEVLDRVERAYPRRDPDARTVRLVAEAWAEAGAHLELEMVCHDPLTSFGTVPCLRGRLDALYRQAAVRGTEASLGFALVVVELPERGPVHPFDASLRALEVAEAFNLAFPAHELLARVARYRFAALVEAAEADVVAVTQVARLLDDAQVPVGESRIWIERLPSDARGLSTLLAGLTR